MRLIDADAFERKVMCGDEEDVQDVIYSLRDFPTAYDIDKVVEQLEKLPKDSAWNHNSDNVNRKKTIEIVKGGGVNE